MDKLLIPIAIFAAIAASSVSAAAAPADGTLRWTRIVNYADLDLGRTVEAETLYTRFVAAARSVCEPDLFGVPPTVAKHHCVEDALAAAVATVNAPALTVLFQRKQGGTIRAPLTAEDRTMAGPQH
jgi:UrcA family protein